jgi:hypothetical protein
MFLISGIIYYHTLSESKVEKILGVPEKWFWAIAYSAFCVFVECLLNLGGHLVWEYPFWNLSFAGVWLIFLFGYFHFFGAALVIISLKTMRSKLVMLGTIYSVAVVMNVIGFVVLGWNY